MARTWLDEDAVLKTVAPNKGWGFESLSRRHEFGGVSMKPQSAVRVGKSRGRELENPCGKGMSARLITTNQIPRYGFGYSLERSLHFRCGVIGTRVLWEH